MRNVNPLVRRVQQLFYMDIGNEVGGVPKVYKDLDTPLFSNMQKNILLIQITMLTRIHKVYNRANADPYHK